MDIGHLWYKDVPCGPHAPHAAARCTDCRNLLLNRGSVDIGKVIVRSSFFTGCFWSAICDGAERGMRDLGCVVADDAVISAI